MKSYDTAVISSSQSEAMNEIKHENVGIQQPVSGELFDVYRLSENDDAVLDVNGKLINHHELQQNNVDTSQAEYVHHRNAERRDSGFHTMKRYSDNLSSGENDTGSLKVCNEGGTGTMTNYQPIGIILRPPSPSGVEVNEQKSTTDLPSAQVILKRSSPLLYSQDEHASIKEQQVMEVRAMKQAKKLYEMQNEDKRNIVRHLSQTDKFGLLVARNYMDMFDFSNISLDESLRMLLERLALLGETQERERVLHQFSQRYSRCNANFLSTDADSIHTLVCAIALLNTDLHSARKGGRRRMTCKQFINNLNNLGPQGKNYDINLLKYIYHSIRKKPLPWCGAGPSQTESSHALGNNTRTDGISRQTEKNITVARSQSMNTVSTSKGVSHHAFHKEVEGRRLGEGRSKTKTLPRKQGVLWRKPVLESDGNKTPKRRRKWKLAAAALQGLEMHLAKKDSTEAIVTSLHHCLAEAEPQHRATKRMNVFRVTSADTSACLYQASAAEDVKAWICAINRNASLLSSAPLSAGIGSQLKFQRPLLPSSASTLPMVQQLQQHRERLESLRSELGEIQKKLPLNEASDPEKQFKLDKEAYLRSEIRKYEVYVKLLEELRDSSRHVHSNGLLSVEEEDEDSTPDTDSLLSISPSEPGFVSPAIANSTSSERSGSFGNILQFETTKQKKKPKQCIAIPSQLNPTSSLPNLYPMNVHRFSNKDIKSMSPFGAHTTRITKEDSHASPHISTNVDANHNLETQNDEVPKHVSFSNPTPPNFNNSNRYSNHGDKSSHTDHVISTDSSAPLIITSFSKAKYPNKNASERSTGARSRSERVLLTTPNNFPRMEVRRHISATQMKTPPVLMSTSYLSNTMPPLIDGPNYQSDVTRHSLPNATSPRSIGRKHRKGSSRLSYMRAVQDNS